VRRINQFAAEVFRTRGGRIGSGMGTVLEAMWGYELNRVLRAGKGAPAGCELAWMYSHGYNDFACVLRDELWDPNTRQGELLRVEAKSMVASAGESKAHFDAIQAEIGKEDLLVLLVWDWMKIDVYGVSPRILRYYVGSALSVAKVRDELHLARGGSFVNPRACPDKCLPTSCTHGGEPLNEKGKRERLTGPESLRGSPKVSYAANFGGMVRMLKASSPDARARLRLLRRQDGEIHKFVSFIHETFPAEEENHYSIKEWRAVATKANVNAAGLAKPALVAEIRRKFPAYQDLLLTI
jgi:hypothetical protein